MLEFKNPLLRGFDKVMEWVIMILLMALTLIIGGACLLRTVHISFVGFEELATLAAFWLYMVGTAYGSREKSQITADILEVLLPESRGKEIMMLVKWLLTFILSCVFAYWAFTLVMWTLQTGAKTTVYKIPNTLIQSSILVGTGLSAIYNLLYLVREIKIFLGKEPRHVAADDAAEKGE